MTRNQFRTFQLILAVVLRLRFFLPHALAQERAGVISGQLLDQAGGSLPDALIVIENALPSFFWYILALNCTTPFGHQIGDIPPNG